MSKRGVIGAPQWIPLIALLVILTASGSANGQGFMVKPMKMELATRAGQPVETILELRNTGADEAKTLDLTLIELSQNQDGTWQIIEAGSGIDTSKFPSCLKWVKLSANSVTVDPMKMTPVTVTVTPPPSARGFYLAGLIAQTRPKPGAAGVAIVVRFLIPILVEIEGRPERQKIELNDLGLTFRKPGEKILPGTIASFGVVNEGRTYSRIKGSVKVMYFSKDKWRPVSTVDVKEIGIIPGVTLKLGTDLQRRLPSGKYKLTGQLYVDGRRVKPLEKEIDFVGDPAVTKLAVDTALILDPPTLSIPSAPGSTRTTTIKVENASDDPVEINASSVIPPSLRGVAMGELKGDELSCAGWISVSPEKFTLRAGGKQNVRVIATMPKTDKPQANYYGLLTLKAAYPDGQSAGETSTLVCVSDKKAESKPSAEPVKVTVAAGEGSQYIVQARFANTGNVDYTPICSASVLSPQGRAVTQVDLAGQEGLMLPLETRDFSGTIDFDKIEPGTYAFKVVFDCGGGKGAAQQLPISVSVEEGKKVDTIVQAAPEEKPKP